MNYGSALMDIPYLIQPCHVFFRFNGVFDLTTKKLAIREVHMTNLLPFVRFPIYSEQSVEAITKQALMLQSMNNL